jgi:6-phosphogluconolactonase (cycloisomerase 2 family)
VDQNGTIDGYTLNATAGTFGLTSGYTAPVIPPNTGGVGMVVAQDQFLYAGFASTDQIYGWTINSSGSLTAIAGTPFSAPYLSDYVSGVGQANMITDPAGTMLFISDTLGHQIYVYTIGSGGVLNAVTGSPFALPAGFESMNLSTDGLGKYLYAINGDFTTHTGSEIAGFAIGSGANLGKLTPVVGSPFAYPMWLVKGEPSGQFLIGTSGNTLSVSGTDDDNLYVFSITPSGANAGAITQVAKVSTSFSPYSIAVQSNANGNLVYSFSFNDTAFNAVEGYQIVSTGTLTRDTGSPFSGVADGSWGQFDQSGNLLFAYSSYLDASTNEIVTQLAPLDVSSAGVLTQPVATLTLKTAGFWAVTDPQ